MSPDGVSLAELGRHVAARPSWRCRVCAAPWPCQPAKLALHTQYADDRPDLAIYLCLLMHDAIADRLRTRPGQVDPAEFFARFLSWTRPRGAAPVAATGPRAPRPAAGQAPRRAPGRA